MKRRRHILALVAGLWLAAVAATTAPAGKTVTAADRLKQRIDALLKHRLKPDPLPVILPNPFEVVSGVASSRRPDEAEAEPVDPNAPPKVSVAKLAEELPPGSSTEALARCAAKLRIGGTVTLKGHLQIIINESPRKEGDTIVLDRNNAMTYLQVTHIAPGEFTLRLNEATLTVKF